MIKVKANPKKNCTGNNLPAWRKKIEGSRNNSFKMKAIKLV
jgi:hypothetical protein